jgi:hypothetical protein
LDDPHSNSIVTMTFVRTVIQRTCVAFAVRASYRPHLPSGARWISVGDNFVPPPPPTSKGIPVFPDIDFSHAFTSEAVKRNADPDAVFVVNGSSRGIGLQFVKSLVARTKVSPSPKILRGHFVIERLTTSP